MILDLHNLQISIILIFNYYHITEVRNFDKRHLSLKLLC